MFSDALVIRKCEERLCERTTPQIVLRTLCDGVWRRCGDGKDAGEGQGKEQGSQQDGGTDEDEGWIDLVDDDVNKSDTFPEDYVRHKG